MKKTYTQQQELFIAENINKMTYSEIGRVLNRSMKCVSEKIRRMGLRKEKARPLHSIPGYSNWASMIQRCTNPKCEEWRNYGGRGISVCDSWRKSFKSFLADVGEKPAGHSIDRINPDGNYCKENCRWIPKNEQGKTTRRYLANGPCFVCSEVRASQRGRCHRCHEYFRRNGTDRPTQREEIERLRAEKLSKASSKPVRLISRDGTSYDFASQRKAAEAIGVSFSAINKLVMGETSTCAGYTYSGNHERIEQNKSWARSQGYLDNI